MTLANLSRCCLYSLWLVVFWVNVSIAAELPGRDVSVAGGRRYGPTSPGRYYIRVEPGSISMAHTQRPHIAVYIENRDAQPQDDVLVSFLPSEGTVMTAESNTRGGTVHGTFVTGTGGDNPRTASILIIVEDIDITVFVDIVPAVFGR